MAFLIGGANSAADTGYDIDNSLRFNDADTAWLNRTFSGSGSTTTWTISCWIKRSEIGAYNPIWAAAPSGGGQISLVYDANDNLILREYNTTDSEVLNLVTSDKYRDPSAWYHIVASVDTTQSVAANRAKLYINGSQPTLGTATYPDEDYDLLVNATADSDKFLVGTETYAGGSTTFDGYIAEFIFVNNSQLAATSFGETDEDSGIWKPIEPDLTYGTNGLFLEFKQSGTSTDASGMGADTSGNDTHLAPTDLAATDQTTDTPTNNFATLNPVSKLSSPVTHEGNLEYDSNSSSGSSMVSTIAPSNGKWYVEIKAVTSTIHIGVSEVGKTNWEGQGAARPNINYQYGGGVEIDGSIIDTEASFTTDDIMGFALNLDDGELILYKNGTALNSGTAYDLHTNTTHGNIGFSVQTATGSGNTKASFNFGNPAFSISSGNADANGYGNFEYAVPSGYYALCTKNLAEYG